MNELGKICGVSHTTILNWMKIFDIKRRRWHTKKTKKKIIESRDGGFSSEAYGLEFNKQLKEFIRKRDNYQCQECGIKENGKTHSCHHVDYDKKNNIPENLTLLCCECHGKTVGNREYWQNHFMFSMQLRIDD